MNGLLRHGAKHRERVLSAKARRVVDVAHWVRFGISPEQAAKVRPGQIVFVRDACLPYEREARSWYHWRPSR